MLSFFIHRSVHGFFLWKCNAILLIKWIYWIHLVPLMQLVRILNHNNLCISNIFPAGQYFLIFFCILWSIHCIYWNQILKTKTQILFLITFDFVIHFKKIFFSSPSIFLSPLTKCIKKSSNFFCLSFYSELYTNLQNHY